MTNEEWLTTSQVCKRLQISASTVHRYIRKGYLRAYRLGDRKLRFRIEDVEAILVPTKGMSDADSQA